MKERPHRLPPEAYVGYINVAFTCAVRERKRPFTDAETVRIFRGHLGEQANRFNCVVSVYCFMPDHLHCVISGRSHFADTKKAISMFKYKTGLWFGKNQNSTRWQKDFWDHVLRNRHDFCNHVAYVLNNPVRAGLSGDFRDYPFSGAIGVELDEVLLEV